MIEGQKKCLAALAALTFPRGERCVPFAPLMVETSYDRRTVRRHIRALARKGLAKFYRGLGTDDDGPGGAARMSIANLTVYNDSDGDQEMRLTLIPGDPRAQIITKSLLPSNEPECHQFEVRRDDLIIIRRVD